MYNAKENASQSRELIKSLRKDLINMAAVMQMVAPTLKLENAKATAKAFDAAIVAFNSLEKQVHWATEDLLK